MDATKPSVLVVEDETTLRRLLEYRLKQHYSVRTAANGLEALDRVAEAVPDVVVSDIMMPKMDGFGLLEAILADKSTKGIPFIFLTAKADEQSRLFGLRQGVDAYMTKPFDIEELIVRIERLLERRRQYQTELDERIGQDFTRRLQPKAMPIVEGYELHYLNLPKEHGGGDFFDWMQPAPGVYYFTLGDVMGKGLKAKFYAFSYLSYVRGTIRAFLSSSHPDNWSPAALLERVNRILLDDNVMEETFASLLIFKWEPALNRITYCNAGHCRPLLVSTPELARIEEESDIVLGLHDEPGFQDIVVDMVPNTGFVCYTDGLLEYTLNTGEMVGEERLLNFAVDVRDSATPDEALCRSMLEQGEEPHFQDDVLLFWLHRKA